MDSLLIENKQRRFGATNQNVRIFLAELMGTFILLMFGIGSVAALVLGNGTTGTYLSINFGFGIGCCMGVYWSAGVSGGHINPAVTLAMAVCGRVRWGLVPLYMVAQFLGAFLGAALCFGVYKDLIEAYEKDLTIKTAGIFSTYPYPGVTHGGAFGDQFVGTLLLVSTICALTDKRNNPPSSGILPLIIGLIVFAIGISFGINCGYGINPARDFSPRLFTAIAGWGKIPFQANDYWFWIPILGQFAGGIAGAFLYVITIEMHHPSVNKAPYRMPSEELSANHETDKTAV